MNGRAMVWAPCLRKEDWVLINDLLSKDPDDTHWLQSINFKMSEDKSSMCWHNFNLSTQEVEAG